MCIVEDCQAAIMAIRPRSGSFAECSKKSRSEYLSLANILVRRARDSECGLIDVVSATTSSRTFQKRMAALRFYLHAQHRDLMQAVSQASPTQMQALNHKLQDHLLQLKQFPAIQQQGLQGRRENRRSKRQALQGLPGNWRTLLCQRAARGRYAIALLALSLSGCRPSELAAGILIWYNDTDPLHPLLHIGVNGTKVKATQGQPYRCITYSADDPHPIVATVLARLNQQEDRHLHVQIDKPGNLTVEIRRLACSLWPRHKHSITAYCFRHQFGADLKAGGDSDVVSRGLGHCSSKTRGYYGTAGQASKSERLTPLEIEAERPIKATSSILLMHERKIPIP